MKKLEKNKRTGSETENKKVDFQKLLNQLRTDIQAVRELIPAIVDLNQGDRRKMPQVGAGRWAFVETALHRMLEHPNMLPVGQTKESVLELQSIFHLIKEVGQTLDFLNHSFQDLKTIKMNECLNIAFTGYGLIRLQSKNNSNDALAIYQQLKALLPKTKKAKAVKTLKDANWKDRLLK